MFSEVSFLKWKVIMNKSWLTVTVIYWKPALKFKSHSFVIHSRVCERTHDKRKQYFFNKLACATDVKSLKIHCGIPTFYYFHVLFFPCFFKLCPFFFPQQERFQVKNPPHTYLQKLRGYLDPAVTRKVSAPADRLSSAIARLFHCCGFSVPSEAASLVQDFPPSEETFHARLLEEDACELWLSAIYA